MANTTTQDFPTRLKQLRKTRELSQADLAERAGVHFTQISRYERGETKISSGAAASLARALETTVDYLMSGGTDDAATQLADRELLDQFRAVEQLDYDDKHLVKIFLDAFVTKRRLQQLAQ